MPEFDEGKHSATQPFAAPLLGGCCDLPRNTARTGEVGGKLGQKYIRSWKEGWLPKSAVLQLAPSFAPCLSWRFSCKTNMFVLLLFVKSGRLQSEWC